MHGSYQLEEGQTLVDIKYENEPTGNGKKYGLYALMLTSVGLGVAAVSNLNNNAAHTSSNLAAARQANKVSMKVSASNEYGDAKEKMFKYPFLGLTAVICAFILADFHFHRGSSACRALQNNHIHHHRRCFRMWIQLESFRCCRGCIFVLLY